MKQNTLKFISEKSKVRDVKFKEDMISELKNRTIEAVRDGDIEMSKNYLEILEDLELVELETQIKEKLN